MKNLTRSLFRISHFAFRIICAVLFLLCACGGKDRGGDVSGNDTSVLADIDSMMWRQPDSAFVMLQAFASSPSADSLGEFDGHYFHLLLSELLYKNDYAQTNRGELLRAAEYFDSLYADRSTASLAFLDARAHYIKGVGYYETDSVVEACREYFKALEAMEERFGENGLKGKKAQFMALTYTHLCALFSDQYLHEQAVFLGKRSLTYYFHYKPESWHITWMLDMIGSQYDMMEQLDSADYYYQLALDSLPDATGVCSRDLRNHRLLLAYKIHSQDTDTILQQLKALLSSSESSEEYLMRCLSIGEVYYCERQYDSTLLYMHKVYDGSTIVAAKKQAAERLAETYKMMGKTSESKEFSDYLTPFANDNEKHGLCKSQLASRCYEFEQWRQRRFELGRESKQKAWGIVTIGIVLVLASTLILSFYLAKKRLRALKKQKDAVENGLRTKEIQHHAILQRTKNEVSRLREENRILNEDRMQNNVAVVAAQPVDNERAYQALLEEDICLDIMKRLNDSTAYSSFDVKDYKAFKLSSKELADFTKAIEQHCPNFNDKLLKAYPELKMNDIQLCRFYLLNPTIMQVAILLNTDYSSIRKRSKQLKIKMGCNDLYSHLKSLLF